MRSHQTFPPTSLNFVFFQVPEIGVKRNSEGSSGIVSTLLHNPSTLEMELPWEFVVDLNILITDKHGLLKDILVESYPNRPVCVCVCVPYPQPSHPTPLHKLLSYLSE